MENEKTKLKSYLGRIRGHEGILSLVREICEMLSSNTMPFQDLSKKIMSALPWCKAMALTRSWKQFPERAGYLAPEDWDGWKQMNWNPVCNWDIGEKTSPLEISPQEEGDTKSLQAIMLAIQAPEMSDEVLFFLADLSDFSVSDQKLFRQYLRNIGAIIAMAQIQEKYNQQIVKTRNQILRVLTQSLDARDSYTRGHSDRVARYAEACAKVLKEKFPDLLTKGEKKLHKPFDFPEVCRLAGQLHDVGKIGMGDFLKESRALTDHEFLEMKSHVREGARILSLVEEFTTYGIDKAALWHHERSDKRGYLGKDTDHISACAKVIAIADSFDAMTSDRSYRHRLPWYEALDDLRCNSILVKGNKDQRLYDAEIFLSFEHALLDSNQSNHVLCPGWSEGDDEKIRNIKNALDGLCNKQGGIQNQEAIGNYESALNQATGIRFFVVDDMLPGNLNILKEYIFENEIKVLETPSHSEDRFAPFSIALMSWQDSALNIDGQIRQLKNQMKAQDDTKYGISKYGDAFVIFSRKLPDKKIYNVLMDLSKKSWEYGAQGKKYLGPFGITTMLDRESGPTKKLDECCKRLINLKQEFESDPSVAPIQFYRDRETLPG